MSIWILIIIMTAVTFCIRYALFAVAGRFSFPEDIVRAFRFVPPAVLTAIAVPAVFIPRGEAIDLSWQNPYLFGALAALVVGLTTRRLLLTIVTGMVVFLIWQYCVL
jgi:branched-subunit amino acid transport protein